MTDVRLRLGCAVPPSSPPDTPTKRVVDRILRAIDGWPQVMALVALLVVAGALGGRGRLALELAAFAIGGGFCLANFWRCREAHCVVSGLGWSALVGLTAVELALGHSVVGGYETLMFLAILAVAYVFESAWASAVGSKALRRHPHD